MIDFILVITALFIFIVAPILLLLAFVKPDILKIITPKHPEGKVSRKQFFIGLLVSWIVCLGIGMAVVPEVEPVTIADTLEKEGIDSSEHTAHDNGAIEIHAPEAETVDTTEVVAVVDEPVETTPIKEAPKTFGITPDEFGKRILKHAKEAGLDGDTGWDGSFDIVDGAVNDVFTVILSDALAMNGTVDKNGELKSVTYIMGKTDKGEDVVIQMMMLAGLSARALSPELPKEQTAGVIAELMVDAVKQFGETGGGKASQVVGDVAYNITASKGSGLWIIFEPAE